MPRRRKFRVRATEAFEDRALHLWELLLLIGSLQIAHLFTKGSLLFDTLPLAWVIQAGEVLGIAAFLLRTIFGGSGRG